MVAKEIRGTRTGVVRVIGKILMAALVVALLAACGDGPRYAPDNKQDRAALVAFYKATNGFDWKHKVNWLSNRPIGLWHGVTTDASGRVTHLELPENGLSGRIPPELGSLDQLQSLDLSWNRLTGPIPPELSNLGNLTSLYLHGNGLTGPIPAELGNLGRLTVLSLFGNELSGAIPPELGKLENLRLLYLGSNRLSGQAPVELGKLENLTALSLYGNRLSRQVPPQLLGNLDNLTWLSLDRTDLTGCVPGKFRGRLTRSIYQGLPFCDAVSPPPGRRPCRVGMRLEPGDYCTLDTSPPGSNWPLAWPYMLRVKGDAPHVIGLNPACLGPGRGNCFHEGRIDKEWLAARVNPDSSWTVHRVP